VLREVQASQAGQYTVVARSATGVTSPAAILTVAPVAPFQLSVVWAGRPPFLVGVTAPPCQTVVIQTSSNLRDWVSVTTNVTSNGTLHFMDPAFPSLSPRFYRGLMQ